jgi:hypothetical protein
MKNNGFLFASTVPILIVVRIQLIRMIVQIILCLHRLHLLPALSLSCSVCLRDNRHCRQPQEFFDCCSFHNFCYPVHPKPDAETIMESGIGYY